MTKKEFLALHQEENFANWFKEHATHLLIFDDEDSIPCIPLDDRTYRGQILVGVYSGAIIRTPKSDIKKL